MTNEELLKEYILSKYKSVRQFCLQNDFPYSTVDSIFKRGLDGCSVSLAIKICDKLCISIDDLLDGKISPKTIKAEFTDKEKRVILAYRSKPDMQKAVDTLLGIEDNGANIADDIKKTIDTVENTFKNVRTNTK